MRLKVGQAAPLFTVTDITGRPVSLAAYAGRKVMVSFARAAVCPLCNVRLAHLIYRYPQYQAQGMAFIAFFESSVENAQYYLDRLRCPFPLVADLRRQIYTLYGLETLMLGTARGTLRRGVYREARQRDLGIASLLRGFLAMDGAKFRMPAEFLLGPDLRVQRAYYAKDAGDFLTFAELDRFAAMSETGERARSGHAHRS